jgi:tellurite resistance protein TehA-like permease
MTSAAPTRLSLGVRNLPPNIFAMVMATGIVSLAVNNSGYGTLAVALFWVNVGMFIVLSALLIGRALYFRAELAANLQSHAKAPGFFTLVAGPCVLGNQCVLLFGASKAGLGLLFVGLAFWLALSYAILPALMEKAEKPKLETGLNGAWLLIVVGTQAISVLTTLLAPALAAGSPDVPLFAALAFWLVGSMLYIWLIALIFHRILFLPLSPTDLAPPYWINMGAMAISTLAGVRLVAEADRMTILTDLLPFLKGMTLLFWATATWWIPVLLSLGVWRHGYQRVPLTYEHSYWAVVFPLGMYTVCTQNLMRVFELPFLSPISTVFMWAALGSWGLTLAGLIWHLVKGKSNAVVQSQPRPGKKQEAGNRP